MNVTEIMTQNPCTVLAHAELDRAMDLMDARGFHHLPVVERPAVVGIVSMTDLVHHCRTNLRQSERSG